MASRALRLTLVPWLVLFAACSGDRVSEQIDEVSEALSATDRILTFEGTISSAAGADWRPVTGTATSSTTHSEGAHSIALGGSWNPLAQSAALTALGTLTGPPSIDVELPAGYLPQTNYYGQIALYVTCGSSIVNQYLGPVSLSGPTGSFKHYTFPSLPANIATALATTNGCTVKVELNLSNPGTAAVFVDKLSFGQAGGGSGGSGGTGGTAGTGGSAGSSAAGKSGGGSGGAGAGGKAGSGGSGGAGAGGKSGAGGSGGAGAGGKAGTGGVGGAGAGGKAGSGGAGGAGAGGKAAGGGVGGAAAGVGGKSGSGGAGGAGAGGKAASGGAAAGGKSGNGGAGAGGAGAGGKAGAGGAGAAGAAGSGGGSTSVEFFIDLPVHVSRQGVALGASGGALVLSDGVRVLATPSGFSSVSSVKTTTATNLGASAAVQNLWSEANVVALNSGAVVHGNLTTEGTVSPQTNVSILGTKTEHGVLTPIQHQTWSIPFPTSNQGLVNLEPTQVRTIFPGAYSASTLKNGARLVIGGTGIYTLDGAFDVEPTSTLDVDNTHGPVQIYAHGGFIFRGIISPRDPTKNNILIGIAGTGAIPIDSAFNGILVAPNGDVTLGTVTAGHSGAVYAKSINVAAHTDFRHRPFTRGDVCDAGAACDGLCQCDPGGGCIDADDCVTDVGCVGGECGGPGGACTSGGQCGPGLDCFGGVCTSHCQANPHAPECIPPHCSNHVKDGDETGVDCGGPTCLPCTHGGVDECIKSSDCASGLSCHPHNGACFNGSRSKSVCWPTQCEDGVDPTECGSPNSACGQNCECVTPCSADDPSSTCPSGETCQRDSGQQYQSHSRDVCVEPGCPSNDPALCGNRFSTCGPTCVCAPDCSQATCALPSNGCPQGICPGVCGPGQVTPSAGACSVGFTAVTDSDGKQRCRKLECNLLPMTPPYCGAPGAECGDQCPICTPACDGRQCGLDPKCHTSCGSCGTGQLCDGNGVCATPSQDASPMVPGPGGPTPVLAPPEAVTAPVGAVKGMFSVSERGTAEYSIPIDVPPGRAGMEPALSLSYTGARTTGDSGVGWRVDGLSKITRCPHIQALDGYSAPIKNDDTDLLCIDGKRLSVIAGNYGADGAEYRTLVDSFAKIISYRDGTGIQPEPRAGVQPAARASEGPDYFKVWTREGRILTYGHTQDSLIMSQTGVRYSWLLNEIRDRAGNTVAFNYDNFTQQSAPATGKTMPTVARPASIFYTGHFDQSGTRKVAFNYEDRQDLGLKFLQGGMASVTTQRLKTISTYVQDPAAGWKPARTYRLEYGSGAISQLSQVFECEKEGASGDVCKPPTSFTYTEEHGATLVPTPYDLVSGAQLDMNGDGNNDFLISTVTVDGKAMTPALQAALLSTDIATDAAATAYPPVGLPAQITWGIIKMAFWGGDAFRPDIKETDQILLGTSTRGSTMTSLNGNGLPCQAGQPMFLMDYDRDGKDDIAGLCGTSGRGLIINVSAGNGTFIGPPQYGFVLDLPTAYNPSDMSGAPPVMYDIDGDSLQDVVSCKDRWTLEVRRRVGPDAQFADPPLTLAVDPATLHLDEFMPFCGESNPSYNVVDIDGDGTAELLVAGYVNWNVLRYTRTAAGQETLEWQPVAVENTNNSELGGGLVMADVNGDGLLDMASVHGHSEYIWLNTGNGEFVRRDLDRPVIPPAGFTIQGTAPFDHNADGRMDLLEHWQDSQGFSYNLEYSADGWVTSLTQGNTDDIQAPIQNSLGEDVLFPARFRMVADVDGDSNPDLVGDQGVFYGSGAKNTLLSKVVDGLGNVTAIRYDAAAYQNTCTGKTWPEMCAKRMTGLVSGYDQGFIDFIDELGNSHEQLDHTHEFQYFNARYGTTGHGFLGFDRRVETHSEAGPNGGLPGATVTTTEYEPPARYTLDGTPTTGTTPPYIYPLAGMVKRVTTDDSVSATGAASPIEDYSAQRRTKLTNTWQIGISINGKPFPKLFNRETDLFERPADSPPDFDGTPPLSTHLETFDTTPLGNIHEHAELWTGGGGTFESRDTVMFYSDDSSDNWLISNILSRGVSETRGSDSATPDYNYTYDSRGLLQSVHRNGLSSDERHTTTYSLDDFGNPTQIIESVDSGEASRATTITYDEDHVYPATVTDPVNHTVQVHFDARWGTVDTVVDANNVIMQHSRDGLGLASTDVDAEGTTTYAYSTLAVPHSVEVGPTGANQGSEAGPLYPRLQVAVEREGPAGSRVGSVIREVDGRGNAVRTTREGFGGVSVVTEQPVDQRGRVSGVTAPHAAGATAVPTTRYAYDRLNRRIAAQHSDGSVAQWQYASRVNIQEEHIPWMAGISCGNGGSSCIVDVMLEIDENGHEKRVVVTDYQGSVLRSIDGNNIDSIANKNDYTPGAFGRAFLVYDNAGNLTTYDHDEYGRLIHTADRDTTAKIYSYNGFDELKTATDAQNRLRTYSYDDIGRVKTVIDASGQTTWTYDFGVNALGRLSSMASPPTSENPGGQQVVYSYEPVASVNRALLNRVDYFIDGVDYAIKYGHDDLGRTSHIDYPDLGNGPAVSVNYHYDSTGILTSLTQVQGSGENELWAMTSATEGYLLHTEEFGNLAQTTYDYTPDQRWLAGIKTSLNGQPQQDLAYTYDDNGQIFSRTDNLTHVRQEHHYDALDRLHSLVQIDLGGTHPSTDYDYDNIGNLTQRGGTTLTYAPGGSHFVNTVGPNSYHYDINGNVETRSGADVPGGSQSFTYTSFDLPRSITTGSGAAAKTTLFEYSADQSRLVRRDPDQVHHFAGDLYQRVATPSGTTEDERFRLYLGTRLLGEIVRKDGADKTEYFHTDHLGSVDLISVAGQSTVIRDDFDPFGKELTPSNPEATRAGFTGQDHDRDLALIDMRGRLYDPTAGRFMSADPVTESPFTTQGLNRYSYVFNDPINLTDPSGFFAVFPGYPEGAVFVFDESALAGLAGSVGLGAINTPLTLEIPTTAQSGTYRLGPIGSHAPAGSGVGLGAPDAVGQNDGSVGPKTSDLRLAQNAGDPGTGTNIPGNVPDTVARPDVPPRLGPGASAAAVATARAAAELAEAAEATLTRIAAFLDSITAAVAINSPVAGLLTCGDSPCGTYIKAPGIPTEADGFEAPKNWDGRAVPNPNGSGVGYPDSRGRVWIPTGEGPTAHGGPHWDVQKPGGGYDNVYPRGRVRPGK